MPNTVQLTQNGQPVFPATDATVVTGLATVATSGSYNDLTNKPTIPAAGVTDVTVGGTSVVSGGVAVIPAIPTVPTIDSAPTASSTNLVTSGGVYSEVHPAVASSQPASGFAPNVMYNLGTLSGNTTFALATPSDANIVNHYYWTFDTSSTAPTITWPSGLSWFGGSAPTINASKHYEISVLDGIAVAMEV